MGAGGGCWWLWETACFNLCLDMFAGTTVRHIKGMLAGIRAAAGQRELELHPDEAKDLSKTTRESGRPKEQYADIGDMRIVKYLGRKVSFDRPHEVELDNRIAIAWKRSSTQKPVLASEREARLR